LAVKHKLVCAVIAIALLVPALASAMVFSVSPGQLLQGGQLGLSYGKFQPYIGLDIMGASGKVKLSDTESDAFEELSAGVTLYIPGIGARYYFGGSEVKPYVYAGFLKSVASVSVKVKTNAGEDAIADDVKDQLTSLLGFWGANAGFGAEYAFSEHFAVGSEYGFRYLHTHAEGDGGADALMGEGTADEITASLKSSTVRVVLNYKF
jgi:opacity protein-like surface antigen